MSHHLLKKPDKYSICETTKKCPECCAAMIHSSTRTVKKGQRLDVLMRHKCGMGTCYNCGYTVNSHQCYIQTVDPAEDEPKKQKKKAKKTKGGEESS